MPLVKNLPANAGDTEDAISIPRLGRSPGGGHSNPLQYSCLKNPMYRGAWQATAHRVTKSWTQLKQHSMCGKAGRGTDILLQGVSVCLLTVINSIEPRVQHMPKLSLLGSRLELESDYQCGHLILASGQGGCLML